MCDGHIGREREPLQYVFNPDEYRMVFADVMFNFGQFSAEIASAFFVVLGHVVSLPQNQNQDYDRHDEENGEGRADGHGWTILVTGTRTQASAVMASMEGTSRIPMLDQLNNP